MKRNFLKYKLSKREKNVSSKLRSEMDHAFFLFFKYTYNLGYRHGLKKRGKT